MKTRNSATAQVRNLDICRLFQLHETAVEKLKEDQRIKQKSTWKL